MHCFRDAPSLNQFLQACPSVELQQLLHAHLATLAAFDDIALGELANFLILEPEDPASRLELAISRNLGSISVETCLSHSEWVELVFIVSDDGFGYVVFIPKGIKDQALLDFCTMQAIRTKENSP